MRKLFLIAKSDKVFFISHLFSPCGRAGGSHMLRYQRRCIVHYSLALKCLTYGSLDSYKDQSII